MAKMALRGLDWGEAGSGASTPFLAEASVAFTEGVGRSGGRVDLQVVAWNKGEKALAQLVAVLSSTDRVFDGLRIPLGWIGPGEEVKKSIQLDLPWGRTGRDSVVTLFLEDAESRRLEVGEQILSTEGSGPPTLTLDLKWETSGETDAAHIQLSNTSEQKMEGLRVRFLYAESGGVELLQFESKVGALSAGARGLGRLAFKAEQGVDRLPLRVLVEAEGFGKLAEWDLVLQKKAPWMHLEAPTILPSFLPKAMKAGVAFLQFKIEDDSELVRVVGFVGGKKMAYIDAGEPSMQLVLEVVLDEGANSVAVRAVDDQGLVTTRSWIINGLTASSTSEAD